MKYNSINPDTAYLMQIDPIATGRQLKRIRLQNNLTQEGLSHCFEMGYDSASKNVISMWETGKRLPSLAHVVFLAELYGCRIDELVVSLRRSREAADRDQPVPFKFIPCSVFQDECTQTRAFVFFHVNQRFDDFWDFLG